MSKIDWLIDHSEIEDSEYIYNLDTIKAKYEVLELVRDGYLVLHWDKSWLHFAVLNFHYSDDEKTMLSVQFHGEGPTDGLRECRHTWWGDGGYLFYPKGDLIAKAIGELSKYFDEMGPSA